MPTLLLPHRRGFLLSAIAAIWAAVGVSTPAVIAAEPIRYTQNFTSNGADVAVQFTAWVPEGLDRVRGLFVTLPGFRGDQQGITRNGTWQRRLQEMEFGIVGFRDATDANTFYWGENPAEAQGNLQQMLDSVADSFGHPEISNAPIMLDGVSQGGFVVGNLAAMIPDRTLGFIADKGYSYPGFTNGDYSAPGLVIAGERDDIVNPAFVHFSFAAARADGANVAFLSEWDIGHSETSENLRLTFIRQAIRARYPENQLPSLLANQPLPLIEPAGWLAEAST